VHRRQDDVIAVGNDDGAGFAAVGGVDEAVGLGGSLPQAFHGGGAWHHHRHHPIGDHGIAEADVDQAPIHWLISPQKLLLIYILEALRANVKTLGRTPDFNVKPNPQRKISGI
jgi:hypothetical protein